MKILNLGFRTILTVVVGTCTASALAQEAQSTQSVLVTAVSHSIATGTSYDSVEVTNGFKWSGTASTPATAQHWDNNNAPDASGFKWLSVNSSTGQDSAREAGSALATSEHQTAGFKWNSNSESNQTGFKWGIRSTAEQAGFKWGIRSTADQSGFKWGIRSTADQSGFKWGIRSTADQSGFKWGIRSTADQSGFKWGIR